MRHVSFKEEMKPSDLDGSISQEQPNYRFDISGDADNSISAERTSDVVNEAADSPEIATGEKKIGQLQENTALPECREAAETALVNPNHAFTDDFSKNMNEFETATLFS